MSRARGTSERVSERLLLCGCWGGWGLEACGSGSSLVAAGGHGRRARGFAGHDLLGLDHRALHLWLGARPHGSTGACKFRLCSGVCVHRERCAQWCAGNWGQFGHVTCRFGAGVGVLNLLCAECG